MSIEIQVTGPPGAGKSSSLAGVYDTGGDLIGHNIARAAEKYGPEKVIVSSFTKAAATVMVEKSGQDIPRQNIGTTHALGYRLMDSRLPIAETKAGVASWNEWCEQNKAAQYKLPLLERDETVDEPSWDRTMASEAEALLAQMGLLRSMLRPRPLWPLNVVRFAAKWEAWKEEAGYIDFTDMLEAPLREGGPGPGRPRIIFDDEAQDNSRLMSALVRLWGSFADVLVLSADPDQSIFGFAGADPGVFLDHPVPPENRRTLPQSYRVPRAVHAHAEAYIKKVTRRADREYLPRDADGEVRFLGSGSWKDPVPVVRDARRYMAEGKRVMFLASCAYMLGPLLHEFREQGIPYANPYRRNRGDWNPLHPGRGVSSVQRLLEYLRWQPSVWGDDGARGWYGLELKQWVGALKVAGVVRKGMKARLEALADGREVGFDDLVALMEEGALDAAVAGDLGFFADHLLADKAKAMAFPLAVARSAEGAKQLREEPQVIVGTVHSVKGGEAECSPSDELVLTVNRGYVPIGNLDPEVDRLVGFNNAHHKIYRGGPRRPDGYRFTKASRSYRGPLLTLTTERSRTRITPSHHLTVRWSPEALNKWAVYLMRRGSWWRVGMTKLHQRASNLSNVSGPLMRMRSENADDCWILGVYDSSVDAHYYETLFAHQYQVPDLTFEAHERRVTQVPTNLLHKIWNSIDSESGALKLLADLGLNSEWPLWSFGGEGRRIRQSGLRNRWTVRAANLLPGIMEIPTDPGFGQNPDWLPFSITSEYFEGTVYSLDVERWHHYISGGAVVHNCVYVFPDLSAAGASEWGRPGAPRDAVRRLFFVAMTRSSESLIFVPPYRSYLAAEVR